MSIGMQEEPVVDGTESMVIDSVEAVNHHDGKVSLKFKTLDPANGPELLMTDHMARSVVIELAKALTVN
jgi:hypothetical protein